MTNDKKRQQLKDNISEPRQAVSEQNYHMLFESMEEGFCMIERVPGEPVDFRYVEVNQAFTNESGVDELIGKTIREVAPGETEEWLEIYDRVLRNREPVRLERKLVTAERTLELHAFPLKGFQDRLVIMFRDITARKIAQEAKYFLASVVESSEDSIVTIDFNCVITSWNKGAEHLYGYSAAEAVGKPLMMLTLPEDLKQLLADVDRIMQK